MRKTIIIEIEFMGDEFENIKKYAELEDFSREGWIRMAVLRELRRLKGIEDIDLIMQKIDFMIEKLKNID